MGIWGPLRRIRILDDVLIVFAGTPGFDTKLILKPLKTNYHCTLSIRHGPDWSVPKVPIDIHKTTEGPEKRYQSLGRGTFNFQKLKEQILATKGPLIDEIDLHTPPWRERKLLSIDDRLMELFGKRELRIDSTFADRFAPQPASHLNDSRLAIGMSMKKNELPGMIVKAGSRAFSVGIPGLKGLEERLEELMDLDFYMGDSQDDFEDDNESGEEQ